MSDVHNFDSTFAALDKFQMPMDFGRKDDREKARQYALENAVKKLGGSYDGREFLRWCFEKCGVFEAAFPQNEKRAAWEAGRRAFGLDILALCAKAENLAATLIAEDYYERVKNG